MRRLTIYAVAAVALALPVATGAQGVITTVAGTDWVFPSGNRSAVNAPLGLVVGVAVDPAGNLYLTDVGNHMVFKASADGTLTFLAGNGIQWFSGDGGPATSASLALPEGVAVDGAGNVYIADEENHNVRKVSPGGTITTVAGTGIPTGFIDGEGGDPADDLGDGGSATRASLSQPNGLAVDGVGNLYIADEENHRIRKVITSGIITTIAGTGQKGFAGDAGLATNAQLEQPAGVAVDAAGNIYIADSVNQRIRKVGLDGIITTVAGTGMVAFGGDGGPAVDASLNFPEGVTVDGSGNLFIADTQNHRIRQVSLGGIITTVAGTGTASFAGDGGPATAAALNFPTTVAVDAAGALYIADFSNGRVRKVSAGTISTLAGNGSFKYGGDGAAATSAFLDQPLGVAADSDGNFYIADTENHRIRKVAPDGAITTVAGTGVQGFSGDGGLATIAELSAPRAVALNTNGNLYIADTGNASIRRVSPSGIITTVAGTGVFGSSGDGGVATNAEVGEPTRVAVDGAGNLYLSELFGVVRRVTADGIINTFIGGSGERFAGDGGPSNAAGISGPAGISIDPAGNVYLADSDNDRIRKVLVAAPSFMVAPTSLTFSAPSGTPSVAAQQIAVTSTVTGLGWTAQATAESGGDWLAVSPDAGSAPGVISVTVNVATLAQGTYGGQVTVQAPLAVPPIQTVAVELTVSPVPPPRLAVEPASIGFETQVGQGNPPTETLRIENAGGDTLDWTAVVETTSGGSWLSATLASGSASPGSPSVVEVSANVAGLAAGVYSGSLQVESPATNQTETVTITLLLAEVTQTILVSQRGLLFTGIEGGELAPSQSFAILNTGQGAMNWTAAASTLAGGSWLSVSPASGNSEAGSLQIPEVEVGVNVSGLGVGQYSGLIRVEAPGANNSPQFVTVELDVLPAGSNPGVLVRPAGLIFAAPAGTSPSSQSVRLATPVPGSVEARSGLLTSDGGNWLRALPGNVSISPEEARSITLQPFSDMLAPGVYRAAMTLLFLDGSPTQVVNILLLVAGEPATTSSAQFADPGRRANQAQCEPQRLLALPRILANNFASPVGFPSPIEVQLADDCGDAVTDATVVASFSSGDPPLVLSNLRTGVYVGTWRPVNAASRVTVTTRAERPGLEAAVVRVVGQVGSNPSVPALFAGGVVNGANFAPGGAMAPGSIVSVFGRNLASGQNLASRLPLETTLGGATLNVAGTDVPLFFSNENQINAQLPFDLAPNSRPQVFVKSRREGTGPEAIAVPESITVAAVQPAIFTLNQQGTGQGAILIANTDILVAPVGSIAGRQTRPAEGGEFISIFCTGLGATTPTVGAGEPGAGEVVTTPVTATIGGVNASVSFAGLAPSFVGLYQVNVEIPAGVEPGAEVNLVLFQNGVPSNTVTLAIR